MPATFSNRTIDIESLGLDSGAHLLLKRALAALGSGETLTVLGGSADFAAHIKAWCRQQGHELIQANAGKAEIRRGPDLRYRWRDAGRCGRSHPGGQDAVADRANRAWGLAARGAAVEPTIPDFHFLLDRKCEVWASEAADLYRQALASQWDPATAIPWNEVFELPDEIEAAVIQVMTYLIENEHAALLVPARFLGQLHPHYREIMQCLAVQIADEARHVEIFTRRIQLKGHEPALSTSGGQRSLKTLLDQPDFSVASLLLSVMGEGSFVNLLNFLHAHAPDPVTRQIARLASRDEARHVAFGMAHLQYRLGRESELRIRLAQAIESRFDSLSDTSGLNEEVFDALILLAAGSGSPQAIAVGYNKVQALMADMAEGRRLRLAKLGFAPNAAARLASLHTQNFM